MEEARASEAALRQRLEEQEGKSDKDSKEAAALKQLLEACNGQGSNSSPPKKKRTINKHMKVGQEQMNVSQNSRLILRKKRPLSKNDCKYTRGRL